MRYQSRIPEIVASLPPRIDSAIHAGAVLVAEGAKNNVRQRSGNLHDAIHVEKNEEGGYIVVAGDNVAFYGHILEHGGVGTPAYPFLIPAAESARAEIQALGIRALANL